MRLVACCNFMHPPFPRPIDASFFSGHILSLCRIHASDILDAWDKRFHVHSKMLSLADSIIYSFAFFGYLYFSMYLAFHMSTRYLETYFRLSALLLFFILLTHFSPFYSSCDPHITCVLSEFLLQLIYQLVAWKACSSLSISLPSLLTYSMKHSPSWESNLFWASKEILPILRNPKVHCHFNKCPPPAPNPCPPISLPEDLS